ncbi:MAG: PD-(D/E)XK nuclease family protein [Micrococcales bacterium]|nr:PD-(D/E)XK nuclease family protein [Micrococcales bacterium]
MSGPGPAVRLTAPSADGAAAVRLDEAQAAAVRAGAGDGQTGGHLLVLGAPGTGKTTVVVETALAVLGPRGASEPSGASDKPSGASGRLSADRVLVLTATRRAAADLRDRFAARLPGDRPAVRSPAALAYAVLRTRAAQTGQPPPVLVSGPEQDLALAELLAGHAAGEGRDPGWPAHIDPATLALAAFRAELRDLLMRAAERGLDPEALAALGRRHRRPEWVAAARVYDEYLVTWALRATTPDVGARLDPAVVVDEAVAALATWEREVPGVPRPTWGLVLVDDYQEATVATARLLRVLAADGARIVLAGDPDAAVQTFRGGQPSLVARAQAVGRGPGELGASTVVLRTAWRQTAALRTLTRAVTDRIGTVGVAEHRSAVAQPSAPRGPGDQVRGASSGTRGEGSPEVALLPSVAQETAYVAHRLRTAHLDRDVPWDEMAVVTRTGARVAQLRRALGAAGVPVTVLGSDLALRDEPACRPLLDALGVVSGAVEVDLVSASSLLVGPLGGLDALGLRRVRRRLRVAEVAAAAAEGRSVVRSSEELLVELVASPAQVPLLPGPLDRAVERLGRVLTAGRRAAAAPGADARTVLWALWDASGLAQTWRTLALAGGPAGDRADRDLDAVLALFAAAESFADRLPLAGPAAFVDWVRAQDLPADSLATRGATGGVAVLTPAGAAGREWAEVIVVGVQDGVWPDLRLRDSLLGAQDLVDVVAGRVAAPGRVVPERADPGTAGLVGGAERGVLAARQATAEQVRSAQARAAVLADELRSFAVACSRARDRLLVTAVADQDTAPSVLVDLVRPPAGDGPDNGVPDDRFTTAPAPHDLRGVVARLRARLEKACAQGQTDQAAARQLARLAAAGVPGAHPAQWQGLRAASCEAPLWRDNELVPLSPSRLDAAHRCALRWALESAGGRSPDTSHADLGTLVHKVAAGHPTGTKAQLRDALDEAWAGLGRPPGWAATHERRRAEAMMDRLAGYLAARPAPVAVEQSFSVRTGRARLYGQVDRLEMGARPGTVVVADLKTGSTPPTVEQSRHDPQLGAYQLAVDSGAFDAALPTRSTSTGSTTTGLTSAGARLVYVSSGAKATVRSQPPLADDTWARDLVDQVATTVASATFTATTNDTCRTCPVPSSCPLRPEGRQVVAG